jgi:hypothetical protein
VEKVEKVDLTIFSGHDVTVMPLAKALSHKWEIWPGYASHIIFEVREKENGSTILNIRLNEEGCGEYVNLGEYGFDKFLKIKNGVRP